MDSNFAGFVIDPTKCSNLSLEERRDLVHEISHWADNAPEILQSWSRRELLQLICAEMGKERKYTGMTKPRMINLLLKLVSQKNMNSNYCMDIISPVLPKNQDGLKKKRKKESPLKFNTDLNHDSLMTKEEQIDSSICQNLACRATLTLDISYCKRCSCCICHRYDENKDPSLWLVCSSDPPYCENSCGMSCHLNCALKHEKAGLSSNGSFPKLDGSFCCVFCGKVNWLVRCWQKQLLIAKEARRVDVLCNRLSLAHKMLKGTECYKNLQNIVNAAVKMLTKEVGPLDKVSAQMARGIVNRLNCGAEVQKLCTSAAEVIDSIISSSTGLLVVSDTKASVGTNTQAFRINFEDISPFAVLISLCARDDMFEDNIVGCRLWHRSSIDVDYPDEPTCLILRPDTKTTIPGLSPLTEYYFKVSPFSGTKEFGNWEAKCWTKNLPSNSGQHSNGYSSAIVMHQDFIPDLKLESDLDEQPVTAQADSQKGSTSSSDNNRASNHSKCIKRKQRKAQPSDGTSDNNKNILPQQCNGEPFASSNSVPLELPPNPDRSNSTLDSANKKEQAEREYEYCVKVIRWLECEGHMVKDLRVKFLTWFSLKATAQERRVVNAFIDVLIDEPASLVAQLMDAFMDGICNKEKMAIRKGFCTSLWH